MKRKAQLAIVKSSTEDIERFISILKGTDARQMCLVVAMATQYRNALAKEGVDLLQPMKAEEKDMMITLKIGQFIKAAQKRDPAHATGWMVWLHTLRAADILEIRYQGRLMWRELGRGFPHVEEVADDFASIFNRRLDVSGYDEIPQGFEDDGR